MLSRLRKQTLEHGRVLMLCHKSGFSLKLGKRHSIFTSAKMQEHARNPYLIAGSGVLLLGLSALSLRESKGGPSASSIPQIDEATKKHDVNGRDDLKERGGSDWKSTLEKVVPSIVAIKLSSPKSFDTESPGNGWATGFVVDAERGIILTNRHVVGPGPLVAEGIFHNNEEVPISPIYRDPVHDFGFFKYDPKDVRYIKVPGLPLHPEKACIGTDIRVVGNDAAEKLAIASGTLARLDRETPSYGGNTYNDFNTFYFQASSGTSGGSSGSPVMNLSGEVIALNAGGKLGTSASFYLPLNRVKRALELIQSEKPITRGTIQTVFRHKPFDEVRRLGIASETEASIRRSFPQETGMLVVSETIPGGSCHQHLQPGDILISMNDRVITAFVPMEEILDDNVGNTIKLKVERAGKVVEHEVVVGDLHAITPSEYIEIGGAVINPLSYQQARNHGLTPGVPYVATSGYFLQRSRVAKGSIITALDGKETPTLESVRAFFAQCQDGQRVVMKYMDLLNDKREKVVVVHVDRRWFPFQTCRRNDASGTWDCEHIETALAQLMRQIPPSGQTNVLPGKNPIESKLAHSMVTVDYDRPFFINSSSSTSFRGTGLILDAAKGLVVVDRNTVTDMLGDVTISFANTLVVPAKVVFVHPVHNFAFVEYDPQLIGNTDVRSATLSTEKAQPNDAVWLCGLTSGVGQNTYSELVSRETMVSGLKWLRLPVPFPPQYQEHNLEMLSLQDTIHTEGGAVCTPSGAVQALWASFSYQERSSGSVVSTQFFRGIPMDIIQATAASLVQGKVPQLWDLGVDWEQISLAKARELGLSQARAEAMERHDPHRRTVLSVLRRWGGSGASNVLQNGDILVSIDDKIVTSFREVERATQKGKVHALIVRNGQEMSCEIESMYLEGCEVERIVFWQGLLLQTPPLCVATQREISHGSGVYVSCRYAGSPAARYGPPPTSRICEIDEIEVKNLDDFVRIVRQKQGLGKGSAVRIKYKDLAGKVHMRTLKLEHQYWPTSELVYKEGEWHRSEIHG